MLDTIKLTFVSGHDRNVKSLKMQIAYDEN